MLSICGRRCWCNYFHVTNQFTNVEIWYSNHIYNRRSIVNGCNCVDTDSGDKWFWIFYWMSSITRLNLCSETICKQFVLGLAFSACMPVVGALTASWSTLQQNGLFLSVLTAFLQV